MKRNFQNLVSNNGSIEREITAIFNYLKANLKAGLIVERTRPSKGSTFCKGIIEIYTTDHLQLKNQEPSKAEPLEKYALYADTYNPGRIGSVAIYGGNAFTRCQALNKSGYLFGRRIINASVEQGRRPFVDVKLGI